MRDRQRSKNSLPSYPALPPYKVGGDGSCGGGAAGGGLGAPVEGYGINSLFPLYNRSCIILSTKVVFFARASSDNKMFVSLLAATWQKQDLFSLSIIVISKLSKEIRTRAKHCKQGFDLNLGAAICFARVPAVMSDLTSCAHTYLPWGGKLSRQSLGQMLFAQ